MKNYLLALLVSFLCSFAHADGRMTNVQVATLWYEAFDKKDPAIIDKIIDENWVDIPAPAGTPPGPEALRKTFAMLTSTFPDLGIQIKDVIEEGNKVVVRSEITGTQRTVFLGIPTKNRQMCIQAVDIHELNDGKIVRTWHTEDWMTGLHQLGVLGNQ